MITRADWIERRVDELMLDNISTVELLEVVQEHGGLAHKALCAGLRRHLSAVTQAAADRALDDVCEVLHAFAYQRASREYDTRPA
jgi:hypothetical protein